MNIAERIQGNELEVSGVLLLCVLLSWVAVYNPEPPTVENAYENAIVGDTFEMPMYFNESCLRDYYQQNSNWDIENITEDSVVLSYYSVDPREDGTLDDIQNCYTAENLKWSQFKNMEVSMEWGTK
jgi:hypothetical protein